MTLRLVIPSRPEVDSEISVERPWWQFSARFNVAIEQTLPVARMHERQSEGVMMRWGLARNCADGRINLTTCGAVHCDMLQSEQEIRTAWLYGQRGIVPLAGFFLWQRTSAGHYQPHYVRVVNRPVFGAAAVWQRAETSEGEVIESCALVTVDANPLLAEIDNVTGQMPGILERNDYDVWLSSNNPKSKELLRPYPQIQMVSHPVGPYVNLLEFDEPALILPARR
jgi:putative SOS response-associated peptidase YedK